MHEPRRHPARTQRRAAFEDDGEKRGRRIVGRRVGNLGSVVSNAVLEEPRDLVLLVESEEALKRPKADVGVAETHEDGRPGGRRLVAPLQALARLEQGERLGRVDAESLEHLRCEDFAHASLERQTPITVARPGRLATPLGRQVQQTRLVVQDLGEEKAAPVADTRIVRAKLVAVVALRERRREIVGQRVETREVGFPLPGRELAEPDPLGPTLIPKTKDPLGKLRRAHGVGKAITELEEARRGTIGWGDRHSQNAT